MLKVSGLNQYYGGSHTLRDVGLHVEKGAVTCLLGRNGVGKSTMLKCLMGVLPLKSGIVEFEGRNITSLTPHDRARAGIAYVPQGREIFPRLTVEENLRMGLASLKGKEAKTIPAEIFDIFPVLRDMLHRRGGDLSGGQQQQLAIGRALAMRPRMLILDEPTEGIQPSIIKDIERVIQTLAKRGDMGILLVEQYYEFAHTLADFYVVMQRGEVIKSGPGAEMETQNIQGLLAV